jgi:pimeloyl-ACP methyl ester carboxylesterase
MRPDRPNESLQHLEFKRCGYVCRILENPAPRTEPVVVIGGVYQDVYGWARLEKHLTRIATMIIVDLPGSGIAARLSDAYGFDFLSEALCDALDTLAVSRVNLVGMSLGFAAAYGFAQRSPHRVVRLALGGATLVTTASIRRQFEHLAELLEARDMATFAESAVQVVMSNDPNCLVRSRPVVARLLRSSLANGDHAERFAECTHRLLRHPFAQPGGIAGVPALVFTGEHDTFTPPQLGRDVAASIEGARFTTFKEADHLVPLERSGEFGDLLVRYFTDLAVDGAEYLNPLEIAGPCSGRPLSG